MIFFLLGHNICVSPVLNICEYSYLLFLSCIILLIKEGVNKFIFIKKHHMFKIILICFEKILGKNTLELFFISSLTIFIFFFTILFFFTTVKIFMNIFVVFVVFILFSSNMNEYYSQIFAAFHAYRWNSNLRGSFKQASEDKYEYNVKSAEWTDFWSVEELNS